MAFERHIQQGDKLDGPVDAANRSDVENAAEIKLELDAQIFTLIKLGQIIAVAVSHGLDFLHILVVYA